jgi:hypothetical protein
MESDNTSSAAQIILVENPYEDSLILTNFGLAVPDGASIAGIQFAVRRAALSGDAVDHVVQVLRGGVAVGNNHADSTGWPMLLTYKDYGGATDNWGASWTPGDLRSSGFGLSITPSYTGPSAGNERAYIDSVRVTVFFNTPCD